jgi:OOP family OmpA-OmpF porin
LGVAAWLPAASATAQLADVGGSKDHPSIKRYTDKTDIKSESAQALREIATLLEQDPELTLHVVGHTDNVGGDAYNMDLSRRRASAVVTALASQHGIDAARLKPAGVGPLAPVARNDGEEGRARNRRVELVKR